MFVMSIVFNMKDILKVWFKDSQKRETRKQLNLTRFTLIDLECVYDEKRQRYKLLTKWTIKQQEKTKLRLKVSTFYHQLEKVVLRVIYINRTRKLCICKTDNIITIVSALCEELFRVIYIK